MQKNDKVQLAILMAGMGIGHFLPISQVGPLDVGIWLWIGAILLVINKV